MAGRCQHGILVAGVALVMLALPRQTPIAAQRGAKDTEWRYYCGDAGGTKYSPLKQISRSNLDDLDVAWRCPSADRVIQAGNPLLRASTTYLHQGKQYVVVAARGGEDSELVAFAVPEKKTPTNR